MSEHTTEVVYVPPARHQARCRDCDWRGEPHGTIADAEEEAACHELAAAETTFEGAKRALGET